VVIDFWGDNPFAKLDLPFPPVPSGQEIGSRITQKRRLLIRELRGLEGRTDEEAKRRKAQLEAEVECLKELRKQLIDKAKELAGTLPFDTLLAMQSIAPDLFVERAQRSDVIAQAWRALWLEEHDPTLSDTQRQGFEKDFTYNPLLDGEG
jgi:hypothetical protein